MGGVDTVEGERNIDVNISIGTIFSILRARSAEGRTVEPALQPGRRIVAAGYAIYGSATTLVLSSGHGVQGFTLDPGVGEFFLSHPDIRCPQRGTTYSINEDNSTGWNDQARNWNPCIKPDANTPQPNRVNALEKHSRRRRRWGPTHTCAAEVARGSKARPAAPNEPGPLDRAGRRPCWRVGLESGRRDVAPR